MLARVVAISKEKNGRALTNASRKADLKPLADAYNEERKTQFAKLGQLSDQIAILDYQERYHGDLYAFDSSLSNNRLELSDNIILCYNEEKTEVFKCQKQVISF